jgi:serine/threonine protein phosphatase PrpC
MAALQGIRPTMEDAMSVVLDMPLGKKGGRANYFGVFDGHGGHTVADLLETEVPERLRKTIKSDGTKDISKGLHQTFMAIDADLIKDKWSLGDVVGSTALVVMVTERDIIVSSTGDSRAVVVRKNGEAVSMTSDHKPTDKNEAARIQRAGHRVEQDREQPGIYRVGGLAMSRSLGDTRLKKAPGIKQEEQAIVATPDIQVEKNKDIDFAVIACDGVWDVMTPQDVAKFVRDHLRNKSLKKVAKRLLVECLRRKSTDNMSAIIVLWRSKDDRKHARREDSEYSDHRRTKRRKR